MLWHVSSSAGSQARRVIKPSAYAPKTYSDNIAAQCIDYVSDGTRFAVGCSDHRVYVIDEKTGENQATFGALGNTASPGQKRPAGHMNRIFSTRFSPDSPNIL